MLENSQEQENNDELTVTEVSENLSISEITFYELLLDGKIPALKKASHWRLKNEHTPDL